MTTKVELDFFSKSGMLTFSRELSLDTGTRCVISHEGVPEVGKIGEEIKDSAIWREDVLLLARDDNNSRAFINIRDAHTAHSSPHAYVRRADGSFDYGLSERRHYRGSDSKRFELNPGDELIVNGQGYDSLIKQV